MIKAIELQIGDYVLVSGTPRRVESITKKKIGYHKDKQKDGRLYYARLCEVEPIDLTNALLEKNFEQGATPNHFQVQIGINDIVLDMRRLGYCFLRVDDAIFVSEPSMNICIEDSLHILQNALRTCNIEIDWEF